MSRNTMLEAYIECAFWSSQSDDDKLEGELAPETLAKFMKDTCEFRLANQELLRGTTDWSQVGHDFWLTRNRHGAGFWDRGLGELGDKLTESAHKFGEAYLYTGDDGLIYQSP